MRVSATNNNTTTNIPINDMKNIKTIRKYNIKSLVATSDWYQTKANNINIQIFHQHYYHYRIKMNSNNKTHPLIQYY